MWHCRVFASVLCFVLDVSWFLKETNLKYNFYELVTLGCSLKDKGYKS